MYEFISEQKIRQQQHGHFYPDRNLLEKYPDLDKRNLEHKSRSMCNIETHHAGHVQ